MGKILIGTSGYNYPHWGGGVFYPKKLPQRRWLEFYSREFNTVELNVTFYRLPQESAFLSWRKRTPDGFKFAVKGSRFITHVKRLKDPGQPLKLFFSRVKLLKEKLGPVLWQLPPSFKSNPKRLAGFLKALKKYKSIRQAFEFRNETWFSDEIFKMLKLENASLCSADFPIFSRNIHVRCLL